MSVDIELPIGETVTTEDPVVNVKSGLPAGRYRVRLVVETEAGVESQPAQLRLLIREQP